MVELADRLVNDFDVVDFLHLLARRATDLLDVAEAGLLLADPGGTLHVMASSSELTTTLELFQLQNEEGPCLDCYHRRAPVLVADLDGEREQWPRFVPEALAFGFASVHALPMRLRDRLIGVMGLFGTAPGDMTEDDLLAGQAMADVATVSILYQRALHETHVTVDQLHCALTSRILIEQAKGMLAQRGGLQMEDAFAALRGYARSQNRRLSDLAHDVTPGAADLDAILGAQTVRSPTVR